MKYIFKNIIKFIRNDTQIFILVILTVIMSSFMLHFSYAVYQNYEIKKESVTEEQDYIYIDLTYDMERVDIGHPAGMYKWADFEGDAITIDMLEACLKNIDEDVLNQIDNMYTEVSVDNIPLSMHFLFDDGKFIINDEIAKVCVSIGRYFSQEEFDNGEKVAMVFDYENINIGDNPLTEEMLYDESHIKIGDEIYEIIGYHHITVDTPLIPITALPKDTILCKPLNLEFKDNINLYQYTEVYNAVTTYFGELAYVWPANLPNIDTIRLYNTIIIIAVIISIIAAINFAILYRYILNKRQRQITCMRLCGLKYYKTIFMYIGECMVLTLPVYILTAFSFAKWVLPWMSDFYQYGFTTYNKVVYLVLFGIYFVISLAVLLIMLLSNISKKRVLSEG